MSFDFDDFLYGTGDAKAVQFDAETYDAAGVIEAAGTSNGAPSSSRSDSRPPRLSQGDPIPIVYSLETHA